MRILRLILLTLLFPALSMAQTNNFTLNGKIGNLNKPAMAYIDYMDNGTGHEDSVALVNGSFKFTGKISGNAYARMALDHSGAGKGKAVYAGDVIYFYFGKEQINITSKDSLENASFSGSKVYQEYDAYNKAIGGTIMALTKAVNIDFNRGTPEQQKDTAYIKAVDQRFRKNIQNRTDKQFLFAKEQSECVLFHI